MVDSLSNKEIESKIDDAIKTNSEITRSIIYQADDISYKNIPSENLDYDEFGFLTKYSNKNDKTTKEEKEKISLKTNERIIKWIDMLSNFSSYKKNNYSKLKSRTRKGVPDCLRTKVWQLFAKIPELKNKNKNVYSNIINQLKENDILNKKDEDIIIRDLHRTFPKNFIFMDKLGSGQRALYKVLSAYSFYNTNTGYVQGMGFITALFLTYMNEESSFWMLHSMMINYEMIGFYLKDFPELRKVLYVFLSLLKKFVPNVYLQFKNFNIYPTMYASQWFFTYFASLFDFNVVVRIYDCILLEGFKIVYRIALGILKLKEPIIVKFKYFEDVMNIFKDITKGIDVEELLKVSFNFSFSRKDIKKFEDEYKKKISKKKMDDEIIKQVSF